MKEKPSSDTKQFLLTLLATTFSIILTFGTSAIIDRRHKEAAKKEMVMMIIYDFDKTIEQVQYADSVFRQAFKAQQDAILHPEHFNSHYSTFMASVQLIYTEFSETTEKVFSSNNTRENSTHGHHQMVNTKIRWIIFFAAKVGEVLYSQQKQDRELTVAHITNFYCQIQT